METTYCIKPSGTITPGGCQIRPKLISGRFLLLGNSHKKQFLFIHPSKHIFFNLKDYVNSYGNQVRPSNSRNVISFVLEVVRLVLENSYPKLRVAFKHPGHLWETSLVHKGLNFAL